MNRFVVSFILFAAGYLARGGGGLLPGDHRKNSTMGLKQYYEISDFRLGGRYDLGNPSSWEFGGEGGKTLESLGAGKLRTAYIAIGHTTAQRRGRYHPTPWSSVSYYSGDSTDMYEQWVKGTALSGKDPIIGPGPPDRH